MYFFVITTLLSSIVIIMMWFCQHTHTAKKLITTRGEASFVLFLFNFLFFTTMSADRALLGAAISYDDMKKFRWTAEASAPPSSFFSTTTAPTQWWCFFCRQCCALPICLEASTSPRNTTTTTRIRIGGAWRIPCPLPPEPCDRRRQFF